MTDSVIQVRGLNVTYQNNGAVIRSRTHSAKCFQSHCPFQLSPCTAHGMLIPSIPTGFANMPELCYYRIRIHSGAAPGPGQTRPQWQVAVCCAPGVHIENTDFSPNQI